MSRRVWLLDLDLGGRTLRLSTQPVVVDGHAYAGTLDRVELRETLDGIGRLPSEREAALSFAPGANLVPYGQIEGRGVLRMWTGSGRGRVQLRGFLRGTEVAGADEPISATLTAESYADRGTTHDPRDQVTPSNFGSARADAEGSWFARIFGTPGYSIFAGSSEALRSIKLPCVTTVNSGPNPLRATRLLICDAVNHARPLRVDVSGFGQADGIAYGQTFGASDLGPAPILVTDSRGRTSYQLDVSGEVDKFRDCESWFAVILDDQAIAFGAAGVGEARTVGQVLRLLVREADIEIDEGEWARLAEDLPYRVGRVLREPSSPMDLAMDLLEQFPAALYSSPLGLGVVRWRYDATRADAVALLREGRNCSRLSGVRLMREPSDAAGTILVEFGINERTDRYNRVVAVTQDLVRAVEDDDASTSVWARTADRSGSTETIEAPWVIDEDGAFEIGRWASRKLAIGAREIDLMVDASEADALLLGSVVLVDLPSIGLREAVALVGGRTMTDGEAWPMRLVLLSPVGLDQQSEPTGATDTAPPVTPDPVQA